MDYVRIVKFLRDVSFASMKCRKFSIMDGWASAIPEIVNHQRMFFRDGINEDERKREKASNSNILSISRDIHLDSTSEHRRRRSFTFRMFTNFLSE